MKITPEIRFYKFVHQFEYKNRIVGVFRRSKFSYDALVLYGVDINRVTHGFCDDIGTIHLERIIEYHKEQIDRKERGKNEN